MHRQPKATGFGPKIPQVGAGHCRQAGRFAILDMNLHTGQPVGGGMGQKISRNHAAKAEVQMKRIGMGKKRGGARPSGKPDGLVRDKRRYPVPPVPFVKGW